MGREKRKGRLNKTGESTSSTGAFIGFGAFANAEVISSYVVPSDTKASSGTAVGNGSNRVRLSPIYTGSDQRLTLLFPKIGQKRDATTKTKALQELLEFFQSDDGTKKTKAEALSHFLYLFQTKLNYDNAPRVRSHAVKVCSFASSSLPKAWKNLTGEGDSSEIHGMLLCARADIAAEVRTAAAGYPSEDESDNDICDTGIWRHAKRILSYHKPVDMHVDLFQKKGVGDGATNTKATKLSESQQEELEERYERIVGTVIEGMRLWLLRNGQRRLNCNIQTTSSTTATDPASVKYLWKRVASPKASLRRQTYALLSTVCQLPATNNLKPNNSIKEELIDPSKMSKLLSQTLAAEKEPANIGMLLETLLAFVVSFYSSKKERSDAMAQYFAKPLTKLFKKGCNGSSPATSWTPTILPLVAVLPSRGSDPVAIPPKIDLLTNVWEGQNHVVTNADLLEVVCAVAETASFLLSKEERDDEDESGVAMDPDIEETCHKTLARCWTRSVQSYLTRDSGGATARAHRKLGLTLAKGWIQLDRASSTREASTNKLRPIVYGIREWFWDEALKNAMLDQNTKTSNLTALLLALNNDQTKNFPRDSQGGLWASSVLAQKFRSLLSSKPTSWVPTRDIYELWITILKVIPAYYDVMFTASNGKDSFEDFVMNKILPWMILHTSNRSDKRNNELAILDVKFFHYLSPTKTSFTKWWDPMLREVLAGEPDLEILTACLEWLSSKEGGHPVKELIAGTTSGFSDFCASIAQNSVEKANKRGKKDDDGGADADAESEATNDDTQRNNSDYFKTECFLRACVGLQTISEPLVGDDVVNLWVDCACDVEEDVEAATNPVLDTLVAMIRAGQFSEPAKIERVLLQSWKQGGELWQGKCLPWLFQAVNIERRTSLIQAASTESQRSMGELSSSVSLSAEFDDDAAWTWTERAYRLLRLCSSKEGSTTSLEPPSLSIVGLGDLSLWEAKHLDYLSTCLMRLIRHVDSPSNRWQLFVNSEADTLNLLVNILIGLSDGAQNSLDADLARRRMDSCAMLLIDIEFGRFDTNMIQDSIKCCISKISSSLLETSNVSKKRTCRGIAVLSQLLDMRFSPLRPAAKIASAQEKLNPDEVQAGDKIWYITKADDPFTLEPCTLVKVHRDLPEEVYFTIRLSRDGVEQERQTLGERLQKSKPSNSEDETTTETETSVTIDQINAEEKLSREQLVGPIVEQLINAIDAKVSSPSFYEIYSIAIVQCGLVSRRGIGTLHYSVVQKLIELQKQLLECISTCKDNKMLAPTLWRLAFALGFGMNIPASECTIPLIGSNATDTISPLLEYDGDEETKSTKEITSAMAAWLSVCSPACEDSILRTQSYCLLFDLAARLLRDRDESKKNHYIALRAIEVGQIESHKSKEGESIIQDSEADALTELTKAFSLRWESSGEEGTTLESNPLFDSIMRASLTERPNLMGIASRQCIGALSEALYEPGKQYFATRILYRYAKAGQPLFEDADDDDLINPFTLDRLDRWAQDMLEDEAEELEDDIASVAQWVCAEQMNDIESWQEDHDIDDEIVCGRMLSWLTFLDIADTASGKDSVNRMAFTSYVSICRALDAMLDLALVYGNVGSDKKVELDAVVPMEDILKEFPMVPLTKLAARVVFRSVEVFPTLSKNWWDSSCPKYLTTAVREFVEKQVSPDILRTAIKTIQNATAFGEMSVQGGSVTREVNATYVQDDFTLSVLIKLPLSFPFRRAEVDCSKTLGVPSHRWKRWSLQITQMLNNQGGTLKDALLLWKENVDKEFEGVEPCPVCYSVLHVKSHKLPNLECNTCHNQFHAECLYEWFKTSGKSVCVICQQPWSGTRIT